MNWVLVVPALGEHLSVPDGCYRRTAEEEVMDAQTPRIPVASVQICKSSHPRL